MAPSGLNTKLMMATYDDALMNEVTMFLSGFFGKNQQELVISPNEKVEIDIKRDDELVAVDVVRGGDGFKNQVNRFSTKEYRPPLYDEVTPITAAMLNSRLNGRNPFDEVTRAETFAVLGAEALLKETRKIKRAIERQAAQALFDGVVTLKNTESLDFKRKATHNITPGDLWSDLVNGNPIADLILAAETNRIDGKMTSNVTIMGSSAWDAFIVHPKVTAYLDNRRIEVGNITPQFGAEGATFQGIIWVGDYRLEIFTYPQFFKADNATPEAPYVPTDQVIVFNGQARLNKAFAAIELLPEFEGTAGLVAVPEFNAREFVSYSYNLPPKAFYVGVQSAPLVIPVAIDTITNINVL